MTTRATESPFTLDEEEWEAKLPKRAQRKLRVLRLRLQEANEELTERGGPVTPIRVDHYSDHPLYVPARTVTEYTVGNRKIEVSLRTENGDPRLYINGTWPTSDLTVIPRASNLIHVK